MRLLRDDGNVNVSYVKTNRQRKKNNRLLPNETSVKS